MDAHCTRPTCAQPENILATVDRNQLLNLTCASCGMPLVLLGRYLPQKLLAQGGFGRTYLARDLYTPAQRLCVVKQLRTAKFDSTDLETAQRLFHREAEVLEALGTHPQIPYLFASFDLSVPSANGEREEEYFYLVQEYIPGEDLDKVVRRQGRLNETEVTEILRSLLGILAFIHSHNVVHRDIKPANTMCHENGTLYLLDFGAVKQAVHLQNTEVDVTNIGSPIYSPPEQTYGLQVVPASDIYALGATCAVLLTGCPPHKLIDPGRHCWQWRSFTTVSDGLAQILDRMLLPALDERYPDAHAVLNDLEALSAPTAVDTALPNLEGDELLNRLREEGGLEIRDRRYLLRVYPRCFVGSDLVTWLMKHLGLGRQQAIQLGQTLVARNIVHHVTDDQPFRDGYFLYRFYQDDVVTLHEPQPVQQLMSYRGQMYQPVERVAQSVELSGATGMRFHYRGRTYETGMMNPSTQSERKAPPAPTSTESYTYRGKVYKKETP
ncbi:serine/threonine protein kinase [Gloeomargarita lithophora Alchichica-D10]|uniref:non-specific serine/threonine protein kinase n=1 Tax=Gloeomargarita lithophora Alchichica-D10 TaxID=1188229 RepID=A0A1J0ACY5_9CYAN|nr:protein kinase [Gloeomargarita lithophora]APB33797.1 serine/threonine protein kinase [Gloeomargarita lithophora Alchichica-D10]